MECRAADQVYQCDYGLHTEEFYKNVPVGDHQSLDGNVDVMTTDSDVDEDEDSSISEVSTTSQRPA
jgi:hypothetical protein